MIKDAEKLFELVTQRPEWGLRRYNVICPYCSSGNCRPRTSYETSTFDPHTWTEFDCFECSKRFVFESKSGQGWYTENGKVLRGFPNCFEDYVYTCSKCGSDVERKCYNKSDGEIAKSISSRQLPDGSWISAQFYRYSCVSCDSSVETSC